MSTNMCQPVDRLYDVLACARRRLPADQLANYLARLADPMKHDDLMFEFAPIVRLAEDVKALYEVCGYSEGNRTIDWLIRPKSGPPIAMDVKDRTKDLLSRWYVCRLVRAILTAGQLSRPFEDPVVDKVVTLKYRCRLVPSQLHRHAFRNATAKRHLRS